MGFLSISLGLLSIRFCNNSPAIFFIAKFTKKDKMFKSKEAKDGEREDQQILAIAIQSSGKNMLSPAANFCSSTEN